MSGFDVSPDELRTFAGHRGTAAEIAGLVTEADVSDRSWGGVQAASAHAAGATTMCRYWKPAWNETSSLPSSRWRASTTLDASAVGGWPPAHSFNIVSCAGRL